MKQELENELKDLINKSPILDLHQRTFFKEKLDIMNEDQKERLLDVLRCYFSELDKLEKKYGPEINKLNEQHLKNFMKNNDFKK